MAKSPPKTFLLPSLALALCLVLTPAAGPMAANVTVHNGDTVANLVTGAADDNITIENGGTVTGEVVAGAGQNLVNNAGNVGTYIWALSGAAGGSTVINSGGVGGDLAGSWGGVGDTTVTNDTGGVVGGDLYGLGNAAAGSANLVNDGTVSGTIIGNDQSTGSVVIVNNNLVSLDIIGASFGAGDVTITNNATITGYLVGQDTGDGDVRITNNGGVGEDLYGIFQGDGNALIVNNGAVAMDIYGLVETDGSVTVTNTNSVGRDLVGHDTGDGDVVINNSGSVGDYLVGLAGGIGNVTIVNSGGVGLDLLGGNIIIGNVAITNSGGVGGDLVGISLGRGNVTITITNTGTVGGGVYGREFADGQVTITNSGTVGLDIVAASFGDGDVVVVNSGTVSGYLVGLDTGDGQVSIVNTGAVGLDIVGQYQGGGTVSIVNSGTVNGGVYGIEEGVGEVAIVNFGHVAGTIFGVLNGVGNAAITNHGRVDGDILAGPGYDHVTIVAGSTVGGTVDGGDGGDILTFYGPGNWSDYRVAGFETVIITGPGTSTITGGLNLAGVPVYVNGHSLVLSGWLTAGGVTLNDSSLTVNGVVNSSLLVNSGSTLGGGGSINGNVTMYGRMAPGNSIGALSINGDYTQGPGATLVCEVDAAGNGDRLVVNGAAVLNGGVLNLNVVRGLYRQGTSWTPLSAAGGLSGGFGSLTVSGYSGLVLSFGMRNQDGQISLEVTRTSYAEFAVTPAGRALGRALDALAPLVSGSGGSLESLLIAMDFDYGAAQFSQALSALDPGVYDWFAVAAQQAALTFDGLLRERLDYLRLLEAFGLASSRAEGGLVGALAESHGAAGQLAEPGPAGKWSLWAKGLGGRAEWRYETTSAGVAFGGEGRVNRWLTLGAAFGYQHNQADFGGLGHEGAQYMWHAALYAGARVGAGFLEASLHHGGYDNQATRRVVLGGFAARARGAFDGDVWQARLGAGHDLAAGPWRFGPQLHLSHWRLSQERFEEGGAGYLNLTLAESELEQTSTLAGFRLAGRWRRGGLNWLPRLALWWRHAFGGERQIAVSMRDYPTAVGVSQCRALLENALSLEAGVSLLAAGRFSGHLLYMLDYGEDYWAHSLSLGLQWNF